MRFSTRCGVVLVLVALAVAGQARPVSAQVNWYQFGPVPETFDAPTYAAVNADVVSVIGTWDQALYWHWMQYGRYEGRLQTIKASGRGRTDWFRMRAPGTYHNPYNQPVVVQSILVLPGLPERVVLVPQRPNAQPYITSRWQPVSAWLEGEAER